MKEKKAKAFGVENSFDSADLILIPVPWEVTASYGSGTSQGPELIRKASEQLDFFQPFFSDSYNYRIYFENPEEFIQSLNKKAKIWASQIQKNWEEGKILNAKEKNLSKKVNQACETMLDWLEDKSLHLIQKSKIPALVGGDHSISEALLRVIGKHFQGNYGILHFDAHCDLRKNYQSFKYSHASVMYNVLNLDFPPKKLIQVGIRDYCEEEHTRVKQNKNIHCYLDEELSAQLFQGENWSEICKQIIALLPDKVYVSLDVDALSWEYAPGTGTPVPGGLSYKQLIFLLNELKRQKKKLIGFDLVETSPGGKDCAFKEWNGNVSARLIYHLAGLTLESQSF